MRLYLHLAARSLARSRVVTSLMLAAIAMGVGFQVPTVAFIDGYRDELISQVLLREFGHIQVVAQGDGPIEDAPALQARLASLPGVAAVGRRLIHAGVVQSAGAFEPVRVVGVDPATEEVASALCTRVATGRCFATDEVDVVILGARLARQLDLATGDAMRLLLPFDDASDLALSSRTYAVVGVLEDGGIWQADEDVYAPLGRLGELLDLPDTANRLAVYLNDMNETEAMLGAVAEVAATHVKSNSTGPETAAPDIRPWWRAHAFVANAIATNARIGLISTIAMALAVMIPVLALLYIHVFAERRDVGVLVATGFSPRHVFAVYAWKGLLVSAIGTTLGILIAIGACWAMRRWPVYAEGGFTLKPALSVAVVATPALIIGSVSFLGGLLPAWLTSRQDPARVLREGV
jgi:lipoprotein-releasing system permease protein